MFRGLVVVGLTVVFVILFALFRPRQGGNAAVAGPPGQGDAAAGSAKKDIRQMVSPEEREAIGLGEPTWMAEHGKVHPDVYATLKKDERPWPRRGGFEGTVYVDVYLRHEHRGKRTSEENKAAIKEMQTRVLSRLTAAEFSVVYQFTISAGLVGYVSSAGLVKLKKDSDVIAVGLDDKPIPKDPPPTIGEHLRPGENRKWTLADGKVEPQVYAALEKSTDGYLYVIVVLTRVPWGNGEFKEAFKQHRAAERAIEHRVLSDLTADEFRAQCRDGGPFGYVNAAGLTKLEKHPDVVGVGLMRAFKTTSIGP